jgi:hypothetical protein
MKQHIKASKMRRSVAMAEIVFRHRPRSAARKCHLEDSELGLEV